MDILTQCNQLLIGILPPTQTSTNVGKDLIEKYAGEGLTEKLSELSGLLPIVAGGLLMSIFPTLITEGVFEIQPSLIGINARQRDKSSGEPLSEIPESWKRKLEIKRIVEDMAGRAIQYALGERTLASYEAALFCINYGVGRIASRLAELTHNGDAPNVTPAYAEQVAINFWAFRTAREQVETTPLTNLQNPVPWPSPP